MLLTWVRPKAFASFDRCAGTTGSVSMSASGRRSETKTPAEAAVEIGQVVETAIERDIADAAVSRPGQQFGGLAQPQFVQPRAETGARLKQQFVDIALRQPRRRGKFLGG